MPAVAVRWADLAVPGWTAAWLGDDERRRMAALRAPDDRARFLGAHVLARVAAAERVGGHPATVQIRQRCPTCGGPHGPPAVAVPDGAPPAVSLAHAGRLVVVAVASTPVGVDVEPVDQPAGAHAAIAEHLGSSDTEGHALLRAWVAHEAVAKARGVGIVERGAGDRHGFAVVHLALDGRHVGAVAVPAAAPRTVSVQELRWDQLTAGPAAPAPRASSRTDR